VIITRFFLIRHALVEAESRARFYGSMDVALCEAALIEEAALYRWWASRLPSPARWIVSNLGRTRGTAAAIFAAGYPEAPLFVEPDFAEQHLGDWQGLEHAALPPLLQSPAHPFWPHAGEEKPPGGESFSDVRARVAPALEACCERYPGEDVVIVAHGGSIRAMVAHAMDLTAHQALVFSIRNLSLTRIEKHDANWRVQSVNEDPWGGS
jgi:alpha-ribazole phosphatase